MSANVRPARPADAAGIWELVRGLARYERMETRVTGSAERLAADLFGGSTPIGCLVAEEDGALVGYAIFYPTYSTFRTQPMMWLEDIFVLPEARGRGLGRALLVAVARAAMERGCWRLDWIVLDWNETSIQFYERLGARRHNTDWYQYGLDAAQLRGLCAPSSGT
jgi:GNAT superfamily N-acetyltransferase